MFADRYMRVYGETFARLNQILMDQWDGAAASGKSEDVHLGLMKLSLDALGSPLPPSLDARPPHTRSLVTPRSGVPPTQACAALAPTFKP